MPQLPFTFAWVNATQTTFDPVTMNVEDEEIVAFDIKHDEGQIPSLEITIRNPRVGLLAPGRPVWAYLAWKSPTVLMPLFFGVLLGVPTNLFLEKVTLKFIARSPQFIANKQALAETMRIAPYYDPIGFDDAHRDDPDAILEGWSSLWHIDRVNLDITASDVLTGEDGTVTFTEDDALYSSVSLTLGQPPLTNLRLRMAVNWTQRVSGFVEVPPVHIASYTGDSFLGGWSKAGASLGGGYRVESSFVTDIYNTALTPNVTYSYNWENTDPNPGQCSNASASSMSSGPALLSPNALTCVLTQRIVSGICDPFSDPPINRPASVSSTGIVIPLWAVKGEMTLRYDARRPFAEICLADMTASVQSILTSPTIDQHTETLDIQLADVGKPLFDLRAWTDFAGQPVGITQIIFPNNPTVPGGLSYQIAVGGGTAGVVEPIFSDLPGVITNDNGVQWASLGQTQITESSAWVAAAFVPCGTIINLQNSVFNEALGEFEDVIGQNTYYMCISPNGGQTNSNYTTFSYTPPIVSNDEPTPALRHISNIDPPTFSTTVGAQITDGTVTWLVLGPNPNSLSIPIGGTPDNVTARHFFDTARGIRAVEFGLCKGRAKLRWRSRAVKVSWDCPFDRAVALSCRKNATLYDPRMPGGAVTGKIISYTLSCRGDGTLRGRVEIGCAIGFGESVAAITGTPVYANPGYANLGWQRYEGKMVVPGSNDIRYTPPVYRPYDDGLVFPLRWDDISDGGIFSGSLDAQRDAILAAFPVAQRLQYLQRVGSMENVISSNPNGPTTSQSGISASLAWQIQGQEMALASQSIPYVMQANPRTWSILLKPCAGNGPYTGVYVITTSPLVIPQGANLEAPSSP